jgi:hypothetical protein
VCWEACGVAVGGEQAPERASRAPSENQRIINIKNWTGIAWLECKCISNFQ